MFRKKIRPLSWTRSLESVVVIVNTPQNLWNKEEVVLLVPCEWWSWNVENNVSNTWTLSSRWFLSQTYSMSDQSREQSPTSNNNRPSRSRKRTVLFSPESKPGITSILSELSQASSVISRRPIIREACLLSTDPGDIWCYPPAENSASTVSLFDSGIVSKRRKERTSLGSTTLNTPLSSSQSLSSEEDIGLCSLLRGVLRRWCVQSNCILMMRSKQSLREGRFWEVSCVEVEVSSNHLFIQIPEYSSVQTVPLYLLLLVTISLHECQFKNGTFSDNQHFALPKLVRKVGRPRKDASVSSRASNTSCDYSSLNSKIIRVYSILLIFRVCAWRPPFFYLQSKIAISQILLSIPPLFQEGEKWRRAWILYRSTLHLLLKIFHSKKLLVWHCYRYN